VRNIQSDGGLHAINARAATLAGTLWTASNIGTAAFGSITGTLASARNIGTVSVGGDLSSAKVLAGADFGSDGQVGGTGTAADSYRAGTIGKVKVAGQAKSSLVAAGLQPMNAVFLDSDDQVMGGSASSIGTITVRGGTDTATRFVAGSFGKAKLPGAVDVSSDERFRVM
jgi:hypothetical protein